MLAISPSGPSRRDYRPAGVRGRLTVGASLVVCGYVGCHPYPARFRAAIRCARAVQLARRLLVERQIPSHANARDRALGLVFRMLHFWGITFPVSVRFDGEPVPAGPMLVMVWHMPFNQIVLRQLIENGAAITSVRSKLPLHGSALGSALPLDTILAGPMALRTIARRLRAGRMVVVAPDSGSPHPTHRRPVSTATGTWFLADAPIRLAVHLGVPVGFLASVADGDTIVGRFRRARSADVDGIIAEHVQWLDEWALGSRPI